MAHVQSTSSVPQRRRKRQADTPIRLSGVLSGLAGLGSPAGDAPILIALLSEAGLPLPVAEYHFARELTPPRRWRFDYAWPAPDLRIALEIEGAIWRQGRHTRGGGYRGDIEKYNAAILNGWLLLRATYDMLQSGEAMDYLRQAFALRAAQTRQSPPQQPSTQPPTPTAAQQQPPLPPETPSELRPEPLMTTTGDDHGVSRTHQGHGARPTTGRVVAVRLHR